MEETRPVAVALKGAAIAALEAGGPSSVQARKLAAQIGASTMAVYTYFGGMPGLWEALVREGFSRLAAEVRSVPETDNSMADFFSQGLAYRAWAVANPQLYRLVFGLSDMTVTKRLEEDMTVTRTISTTEEGQDSFSVMTTSLERVIDSGQLPAGDPVAAAGQFLSATHGYVLLELSGYFGPGGTGPQTVLAPLARSIMIGLGATAHSVDKAIAAAVSANLQ